MAFCALSATKGMDIKMKILHVCTIDRGGAYQAVKRFSECLELKSVDTKILVRTKTKEDSACIEIFNNIFTKLISKFKNGINMLFSRGEIINDILGTDISRNEMVLESDVIILHWVNSFLSCKSIEKLYKLEKPIIWMMHDMWLYTGGCHCDKNCGRFVNLCGKCPIIRSKKERDITRKNFLRKKEMMMGGGISITAPSRRMCKEARRSKILAGNEILYIPNTINLNVFMKLDIKEKMKDKYKINCNKKVILFGAADKGTENANKGFVYLQRALEMLSPEKYMVVIFGNSNHAFKDESFEYKELGYISDEVELVKIYNMADVFVSPANQEAFGFTICEAMACEIPVVAFPTHGAVEQIEHMVSGYIASFYDVTDLARGIEYCVENASTLGKNARKRIEEKYSYERVGKMLIGLCQQLIDAKKRGIQNSELKHSCFNYNSMLQ